GAVTTFRRPDGSPLDDSTLALTGQGHSVVEGLVISRPLGVEAADLDVTVDAAIVSPATGRDLAVASRSLLWRGSWTIKSRAIPDSWRHIYIDPDNGSSGNPGTEEAPKQEWNNAYSGIRAGTAFHLK